VEGNYGSIWWVLFLPVLGFLWQALTGKVWMDALGKRNGRVLMGAFACLPIIAGFVIAADVTRQLALSPEGARTHVLTLFDWITLKSISIPFEIRVDTLSMTMVLIITGVGALIHIYATGYMAQDKDYTRFFTYFNLFIAAMLILVMGNNLPMLFIGWEGVGLCSYLLIGFWYKDISNSKAGNKAFIVNRIGDVGLTIGMFLLIVLIASNKDSVGVGITSTRWLSFDVFLPSIRRILEANPNLAWWTAFSLFVGAMGKSAQFPLYFWLPDAMAGPTPVSALIHAATMVTSGVYLLNRVHAVFDASPMAMAFVTIIGAFTALFGALIAFGQTDIKKVLAYSTVSQLGYMFIGCGVGAYWSGIFHVATHAFFKALLFLGSGAVIYAMSHNQDMRNYGNLVKYIKITCGVMLVAWLAIAGIPGLSGSYSKEAILGGALLSTVFDDLSLPYGQIALWTGLIVAGLTAAYMTRMTMLTFFGKQERWRMLPSEAHSHHEQHEQHEHAHLHGPDEHDFFYSDEELELKQAREVADEHHELGPNHKPREVPIVMWAPLVVLALLSAGAGWFLETQWHFEEWLYAKPIHDAAVDTAVRTQQVTGLAILVALVGIFYGWRTYRRGLPEKEGWDMRKWSPIRRAAGAQFGFDSLCMWTGVQLGGVFATVVCKTGIDGFIDGVVNGIGLLARGLGTVLRWTQTGYVRAYALLLWVGAVGLIGYFLYVISKIGGGE